MKCLGCDAETSSGPMSDAAFTLLTGVSDIIPGSARWIECHTCRTLKPSATLAGTIHKVEIKGVVVV